MPKKTEETTEETEGKEEITTPRYYMESRAFCEIWRNVITHYDGGDNDWRVFVLLCWKRFEEDNQHAIGFFDAAGTSFDTDDDKYAFLSERCYSKCSTIRRGLKDVGVTVEYPSGYRSRNGAPKRARPSYEELGAIFRSDATELTAEERQAIQDETIAIGRKLSGGK